MITHIIYTNIHNHLVWNKNLGKLLTRWPGDFNESDLDSKKAAD